MAKLFKGCVILPAVQAMLDTWALGRYNRSDYHITLMSAAETKKVNPVLDDTVFATYDVGVGQQTKGGATARYIVVLSPDGQKFRKKYGLPPKDFHITLSDEDIHGVAKNLSTLVTVGQSSLCVLFQRYVTQEGPFPRRLFHLSSSTST